MLIDRNYKVNRGITKDKHRAILKHVLVSSISNVPHLVRDPQDTDKKKWMEICAWSGISYEGVAVVTDGWLLAVLPVSLDKDDVHGLVRADAFYVKHQSRRNKMLEIDLRPSTISSEYYDEQSVIRVGVDNNSKWMPRTNGVLSTEPFPNFISTIYTAINAEESSNVFYDLSLLKRVGDILGTQQVNMLARKKDTPSVITPIGSRMPFAVVMPLHFGR